MINVTFYSKKTLINKSYFFSIMIIKTISKSKQKPETTSGVTLYNDSNGFLLPDFAPKKLTLTKVNWKKNIFSSKYKLFSQDKKVGELNSEKYGRISIGEINNKSFKFQKKSFFSSKIEIIDLSLNKVIGNIKFNKWSYKAKLNIKGKKFDWRYDNFWQTKWNISENDFSIIKFNKSTFKGEIKSKASNDLLLLCGLLIHSRNIRVS